MSRYRLPAILLAVQLAAFAPCWRWFLTRLADPSDTPCSLVPIAIILCCAARRMRSAAPEAEAPSCGWLPAVFTAAAILAGPATPPLLRLLLAVCAVATLLSRTLWHHPFHPGLLLLCWLVIPSLPSAQFYLGFPLRALSATLTAALLSLAGTAAEAHGAVLSVSGQQIWFDAPCSGVKLLWGMTLCVGTILLASDLRGTRALSLSLAAGFLLIAANSIRGAYLTLLEVTLHSSPPLLHTGIGLLTGAAAMAATLRIAEILAVGGDQRTTPVGSPAAGNRHTAALVFCCTLALLPRSAPPSPAARPHPAAVSWPKTFGGSPLAEVALSEREQRFASEFPGETRRFLADNGKTELIVRAIFEPTRRLHSAADCLRGVGFTVGPRPAQPLRSELAATCISAVRGTEQLEVCEYVVDSAGRISGDVSTWYWQALLYPENGPWFSYVISRRMENSGLKNTL